MYIRKLTLARGMTAAELAGEAGAMLSAQERLTVRTLVSVNGEVVVRAFSPGDGVTRWIGMDRQLTLTLTPLGDRQVLARFDGGRWLYRGALVIAGTFVIAWPLAVTAVIGAIRWMLLVRRMLRLLRANAPPDVPVSQTRQPHP